MNGENPLPPWLRHALIGLGLFLAGAVLAFGYSYRPLHGALSWQVDQLESRLDERNRENVQLSDALAKQKTSEAKRIDPETLAQVERELDQTKRVLRQAEKDLKRAKRKRKESNASTSKWKKRYEELRDEATMAVVTSPDSIETAVGVTPNLDATLPAPAAPAGDPDESPMSERAPAERGIFSPDETSGPATP
jgi:septal ring factor EnvC (AmiA/AmiB activator)